MNDIFVGNRDILILSCMMEFYMFYTMLSVASYLDSKRQKCFITKILAYIIYFITGFLILGFMGVIIQCFR